MSLLPQPRLSFAFALSLIFCGCSAESERPAAASHTKASALTHAPAPLAMKRVSLLQGWLEISVPADFELQVDRPPNLTVYGQGTRALGADISEMPPNAVADPQLLIEQTEENLKRQDPKLVVLGKAELGASSGPVQTLSVVTNIQGQGTAYTLIAVGVTQGHLVKITLVTAAADRASFEPIAQSVVKSLTLI